MQWWKWWQSHMQIVPICWTNPWDNMDWWRRMNIFQAFLPKVIHFKANCEDRNPFWTFLSPLSFSTLNDLASPKGRPKTRIKWGPFLPLNPHQTWPSSVFQMALATTSLPGICCVVQTYLYLSHRQRLGHKMVFGMKA